MCLPQNTRKKNKLHQILDAHEVPHYYPEYKANLIFSILQKI